jgi:predicted component of type VI protein secretion system
LQFQIEAQLKIDPYPDVSFETILELTTGVTKVKAVRL